MNKKFLTMAAVLMLGMTCFANAEEKLLVERKFKVGMNMGTVKCYQGVPPNGHNYPTRTMLLFNLPSHSLWISNVWSNVHEYQANLQYEPCNTFEKLLSPADKQDLVGTVVQRITEKHVRNKVHLCMRITREESLLTVEGVSLIGVQEFIVGPVDLENCHTPNNL